jgi:dTDP-4-amino-4,6-dideoxy-D-glucose acyltransferase
MVQGTDVIIDSNVKIRYPKSVTMGDHIAIDWGFYCTTQLELKDWIHIAPYCTVIGGKEAMFKMGNFTTLAAGCRIICASDDYLGEGLTNPWVPEQYRKIISAPVVMENYSILGTNVIVFPGVTIAEGTAIGAGSLVNKDTEPWSVYVGTPAHRIKDRSKKLLEYAKEMGYQ